MVKTFAEEEAYGITQQSTQFVEKYLPKMSRIVAIRGFLAGNYYTEPGNDQWVAFIGEQGNRIIVSGFSWGYYGEGPNGLASMATKLSFDLPTQKVVAMPQDMGWQITLPTMLVTETLARYIIALQSVYDTEVGLDEGDFAIRDQLEKAYPVLKEERENQELHSWLWAEKVEADSRVKELRELLEAGFKCEPEYNSDDYFLLREFWEVVGNLLMETKELAQDELLAGGLEALYQEWRNEAETGG